MKTIDETINELTKLKKKLGGNCRVVFSHNPLVGAAAEPDVEHYNISKIDVTGHFLTDPEDDVPHEYHIDCDGSNPDKQQWCLCTETHHPTLCYNEKVIEVVNIHSDYEAYDPSDDLAALPRSLPTSAKGLSYVRTDKYCNEIAMKEYKAKTGK